MGKIGEVERTINPKDFSINSILMDSKTKPEALKKDQDESAGELQCGKLTVNKHLLRFKAFYFLFFAGFGATFPYLGVYFKQIGLNASYAGILAGVRPLIQFASGPFWAYLADRYKARKAILLFSIFAWLVMTLLLAVPRPKHQYCHIVNTTDSSDMKGQRKGIGEDTKKSKIPSLDFFNHMSFDVIRHIRAREKVESHMVDISTNQRSTIMQKRDSSTKYNNTSKALLPNEVSSTQPDVTYIIQRDQGEIREIFALLLFLIVTGEFLEAPSFIMADTALLEHLGDERKHYGKTRLFGSLGYGVASFSIGAIIDRFHYDFCGRQFTNYIIIFYFFAAFMVIAFLFGLLFVTFTYKSAEERGNIMDVLHLFCNLRYGTFLVISWFMGFTHGGIMNFLNWFLEDLGATKLMMGIATAFRCLAIIAGFFTSSFFIDTFGHMIIIFIAMASYVASFFAYSCIPNPWWAIPIEVIQGLCYSMSWSACITYLGAVAPPNTAATMQGVLQGVYWGLGTGLGAIVGGILINRYGVIVSFRAGGVVSLVVVILFVVLQFFIEATDKSKKKSVGITQCNMDEKTADRLED